VFDPLKNKGMGWTTSVVFEGVEKGFGSSPVLFSPVLSHVQLSSFRLI
jgi:hypothetical protein